MSSGARVLGRATANFVGMKTLFFTSRHAEYWETPSLTNHFTGSSKCIQQGHVAIWARVDTHVATQTVQHGKSAQKARFDNLPSGGTPREEAAFSHGVAPSVIVVGAKRDITYTSAVGRQARPVDPLASHLAASSTSCGMGMKGSGRGGRGAL